MLGFSRAPRCGPRYLGKGQPVEERQGYKAAGQPLCFCKRAAPPVVRLRRQARTQGREAREKVPFFAFPTAGSEERPPTPNLPKWPLATDFLGSVKGCTARHSSTSWTRGFLPSPWRRVGRLADLLMPLATLLKGPAKEDEQKQAASAEAGRHSRAFWPGASRRVGVLLLGGWGRSRGF